MPPARIQNLAPLLDAGAATSFADGLRVAQSIAAMGGPRANAMHAELMHLHAAAVARFAYASSTADVHALWEQAVRGDSIASAYWAVLTHPLADRALRHLAFGDVEMLLPDCGHSDVLSALIGRRSVSPRRLVAPGPDGDELEHLIQAALSAPDHGRLHPWRVLEFRASQREALADLFEDEKRCRDPLASAADLRRARAHATDAPCLLAFVVSPRERKRIPAREQWLAAGAAMGNMLNAAYQLGYGAIMLSGDRCFDEALCRRLGLAPGESLAGFISIGTVVQPPSHARRALPQERWACWTPRELQREAPTEAPLSDLRRFGDVDI